MKISIIIPTVNRPTVVRQTLSAINMQAIDGTRLEVILIFDGSSSSTVKSVLNTKLPNLNLLWLHQQIGIGRTRARNMGAKLATGDLLIFLDDDNIPCPDFLKQHLQSHMRPKDICIIGNVRYPDHLVMSSNIVRYMNSRYLGLRTKGNSMVKVNGHFLAAGNFSIKRDIFWKVGGFDERFKMYGGEDVALGISLEREGIELWFSQCCKTEHHDHVEINRLRQKTFEFCQEGLSILVKHYGSRSVSWKLLSLFPDIRFACLPFKGKGLRILAEFISIIHLGVLLELVLVKIDRFSFLFLPVLYHLLFLEWYWRGIRLKHDQTNSVLNYID